MKIYTKTGDAGTTGLYTGERVDKNSLRVQVYGAIDEADSAFGLARAFVNVDEVREKRGLCYSVSASYTGSKYHGGVMCYCGSSNETAQQALDVIVEQLKRLSREGITQTELDRCKIRLKSSLVMSQESTAVHAGQMASDYELFGRVRTMDEILARIDALRLDTVNEKIAARPIGPFRLATLGPKELEIDPALLG